MLPVFFALLSSSVTLQVWGQGQSEPFEPMDFNVTTALLGQGFDAAAIPAADDAAERSAGSACPTACSSLQLAYGEDRVLMSEDAEYDSFTGSYWAVQQGSVNPQCIFKAPDAAAVSSAVLISRLTGCPFAAKSGGHAAFAGASSIEGGITLSFEDMNHIELSVDKSVASVGPGNTWGAVYEHLEEHEAFVIGGRVSNIGVGGLTLGGGISFFSGLYGWACDNVAKYTVVTASGIVVEATPTQYEDLYWALRGSGNNFGLVVNFDLNLYPLPKNSLWGGTRVYTEEAFPTILDAFTKVLVEAPEDGNAGQWIAWTQAEGASIAATEFWYAKPVTNASIFSGYENLTPLSDTTQVRTLADYTAEKQESNPSGLREIYQGLTVKVDRELLGMAKDIFYEELPAVSGLAGANPTLINQGITVPILEAMTKNGGNPLGLRADDGPFYLIHVAFWWENEEDDAAVYDFTSTVLNRITEEATARGLENDYIYMNYASTFQDVISSYGTENKDKLKSIAEKYDPSQVFQKLQPGYFKLDSAPTPGSEYF